MAARRVRNNYPVPRVLPPGWGSRASDRAAANVRALVVVAAVALLAAVVTVLIFVAS